MLDDNLEEEDLLDEFRGGTLSIHRDKSPTSHPVDVVNTTSKLATQKPDKLDINQSSATDKEAIKANNEKSWSMISPLTSIPNKITETLWGSSGNKKPEPVATKGNTIQQVLCVNEDPNNYFTFREGVITKALTECKDEFLDEEADGPLIEALLLTQISNWNSDKERLVLLTTKTLVVAKYDFIALKRLSYKKLPLELIDEVIIGDLVYPSGSLIPPLNGFVDGLSQVLETCLFSKWSKREDRQLPTLYQPRNRNMKGVRLVWNKSKPLNFGSQWNPFNDDIPFCTFTFHPLYFHKDCTDVNLKKLYNVELFIEKLFLLVSDLPRNKNETDPCIIHEKDIILQNYVGLGSVIHNRNSLGFFKVRGKFSF